MHLHIFVNTVQKMESEFSLPDAATLLVHCSSELNNLVYQLGLKFLKVDNSHLHRISTQWINTQPHCRIQTCSFIEPKIQLANQPTLTHHPPPAKVKRLELMNLWDSFANICYYFYQEVIAYILVFINSLLTVIARYRQKLCMDAFAHCSSVQVACILNQISDTAPFIGFADVALFTTCSKKWNCWISTTMNVLRLFSLWVGGVWAWHPPS